MKSKLKTLPARYCPRFMQDLDKRTEISQRLHVAYERIVGDLGGNIKLISHTKLALAERFVWLEAIVQSLEIQMATNPHTREELICKWIQAVNSLTGLARTIGLDISPLSKPSLKTYVEERA